MTEGTTERFDLLPPLSDASHAARPIDTAQAERMIAAAIHDVYDKKRPFLTRPLSIAAAAALALVAVSAAVAVVHSLGGRSTDPSPSTTARAGRVARTEPAPAVPPPPIPSVVPRASEPAPVVEPAAEASPAQASAAHQHAVKRQAPGPQNDPQPALAPAVEQTPVEETPVMRQDLLEEANRLRAAGKWRQAEQVYRSVFEQFRGTNESYIAMVAAAALRVDHLDDPRGALALYQRALSQRPNGDLVEEIQLGIAKSDRALGDTVSEWQVLESFVALHPNSPSRPMVEQRLRVLRARTR